MFLHTLFLLILFSVKVPFYQNISHLHTLGFYQAGSPLLKHFFSSGYAEHPGKRNCNYCRKSFRYGSHRKLIPESSSKNVSPLEYRLMKLWHKQLYIRKLSISDDRFFCKGVCWSSML